MAEIALIVHEAGAVAHRWAQAARCRRRQSGRRRPLSLARHALRPGGALLRGDGTEIQPAADRRRRPTEGLPASSTSGIVVSKAAEICARETLEESAAAGRDRCSLAAANLTRVDHRFDGTPSSAPRRFDARMEACATALGDPPSTGWRAVQQPVPSLCSSDRRRRRGRCGRPLRARPRHRTHPVRHRPALGRRQQSSPLRRHAPTRVTPDRPARWSYGGRSARHR